MRGISLALQLSTSKLSASLPQRSDGSERSGLIPELLFAICGCGRGAQRLKA